MAELLVAVQNHLIGGAPENAAQGSATVRTYPISEVPLLKPLSCKNNCRIHPKRIFRPGSTRPTWDLGPSRKALCERVAAGVLWEWSARKGLAFIRRNSWILGIPKLSAGLGEGDSIQASAFQTLRLQRGSLVADIADAVRMLKSETRKPGKFSTDVKYQMEMQAMSIVVEFDYPQLSSCIADVWTLHPDFATVQGASDYFLDSADRIHFFIEKDAGDEEVSPFAFLTVLLL